MALAEEDIALPTLLGDWTPQRLLVAARMCGFVRRRRKKDVWVLVWILVLGFSVGARRYLTGLHHSYSRYAEELVTFGAFQKWFSAELVALLKQLVFSLIEQQHASLKVPEHLLGRFTKGHRPRQLSGQPASLLGWPVFSHQQGQGRRQATCYHQ